MIPAISILVITNLLVNKLIFPAYIRKGMNLRSYSRDDLPDLVNLEKQAFGEAAYSKRMLKVMFESPRSICFIAEGDNRILGYICALPLTREEADIESIAVDPRSQRSGLGTFLFDKMEAELISRGFREIILEVRENNTQALNFYRKRGFKVTEYLSAYYKIPVGGTRNAYRMRKFVDS